MRHPDPGRVTADWFAHTARARAERVVELGGGAFAVLDARFPRSYDNNRVVATRDVDGFRLVGLADEILGGAGLAHRSVEVLAPIRQHDIDCFQRAGYDAGQRMVLMAATPVEAASAPRDVSGVEVVAVDESVVAPLVEHMWRTEWLPDADDATVEQLVRRRVLLDRAGAVRRPAVVQDGVAVANADLVVGDVDGVRVAEVDAIEVRPDHRGRGLGDALLEWCVRTARDEGADLVVLEALTDDWPRTWYAARGFAEVGEAHSFTRRV